MLDLNLLYNIYKESNRESDWKKFAIALSKSYLLVPFTTIDSSDILITLNGSDGRQYLPIFTDFESINLSSSLFNKSVKFAKVDIVYIYKFLERNSPVKYVVLNPCEISVFMDKDYIESILSLINSRKILFGKPIEDTTLIEKKLSNIFKEIPSVNNVFFVKILVKEESSYLLVIDSDDSQNELLLFEKISKKIASHKIDSDCPFDLISSNTELGEEIMKDNPPIYTR